MCREQIAIDHYLVVRQRKHSRFWIPNEYVDLKNAWDCLTNSFGRTETFYIILRVIFYELLNAKVWKPANIIRMVQVKYYSWTYSCIFYMINTCCKCLIYFIDSASWIWGSHPLSCNLARDEQESKLGEVDECIFASCLMLLFCIVVVGSWYFTAFARTFYVCFHQDQDRWWIQWT